MKYGVVGTGWITRSFIEGARLSGGMELGAIYSRSHEKGTAFAEETGEAVPVYTDPAEMAADAGISAVYIASPNIMHYPQSKLFLKHGLHVLCEKPVTVTPDQHKELCGFARSRGLVYLEAIMLLHQPALSVLLRAVESIGAITSARLDFSQLSSRYPALKAGELPNIFNPELAAGCLMDLGVYCVYAAITLFGYPLSITASAGFTGTGADGFGSAVFRYEDKLVTLTYSKLGQSFAGSEIIGDEGTVTVESISQLTGIRMISGGKDTLLCGSVSKERLMGYEAESFFRYAADPAAFRDEISRLNNIAGDVCRAMKDIRKSAGIVLPEHPSAYKHD